MKYQNQIAKPKAPGARLYKSGTKVAQKREQKQVPQVPTESQEQQMLFQWAAWQSGKYPELALMYHTPNGGHRSKAEAGRFKAEGVKAGVPDIFLPVARGRWHGLYIELKRQRGGKVSDHQKEWLEALEAQDYLVGVCKGWEAASKAILKYLNGEDVT
jgi:hypothetical protein